ncbi:DUF6090 family protein [Gramella sp. GC03-9]|uniref:DUF6090 family protein n=1 Tax=Christiangramia oceanisediminis TaxID=2920386 RepID=A0A9X2I7F8_9FLAO|nr:DUF6090 family protein [Gramella oceanisediminis]MCP9198592.1 DUF6090 family protein [Gramella oceanisediminis]
MIKLFRNIRRRLLRENRFTRYLLYAIGEIILVVIGILIALQINEWNNYKHNRKQERFYLEKLEKNIQEDTIFLKFRIRQIDRTEKEFKRLSEEIHDEHSKEFTQDSIARYLSTIFRFSPQKSVIENLIATGKLDLIKNQKLVDSLYVYYNYLNNFTSQWNNSNDVYTRETIGPTLLKMKGGIYHLEKAALTQEDKIFIQNAIDIKTNINSGILQSYQRTLTRAENIIKMIKKELNSDD